MCAMIRNPTQSWTVGVNYTDLRLPWPFCSTPDLWPPQSSIMCYDKLNFPFNVCWCQPPSCFHACLLSPSWRWTAVADVMARRHRTTVKPSHIFLNFHSTSFPFHTSLFLTLPWSVKKPLSSMFHAAAAADTPALLAGSSHTAAPHTTTQAQAHGHTHVNVTGIIIVCCFKWACFCIEPSLP